MKTSHRPGYGNAGVLDVREVPVPEPGVGETLIRVHATTVSRTDCALLEGRPYVLRFMAGWPRPRLAATGTDFAGEVAAVGPGTARFGDGDKVMGFHDLGLGSHAEYFVLGPRQAAALVPAGVSLDDAAASMEGIHYARNMLNKVPVAAGHEVLVYGATGAIGSAAVALLRDAGALVTAVCPKQHHDAVRALGADRLLDHQQAGWLTDVADHSVHYVFDAVGKLTRADFLRVLRRDGAYISSELGPWNQNLLFAATAPLMRGPKVRFPFPADVPASLDLVSRLLAAGGYRPLIDRRYGLTELAEAFTYVDSGQKIGNVLLKPGPDSP